MKSKFEKFKTRDSQPLNLKSENKKLFNFWHTSLFGDSQNWPKMAKMAISKNAPMAIIDQFLDFRHLI